jgi:hypothetical protein
MKNGGGNFNMGQTLKKYVRKVCPEVNQEMFYNLGLMMVCWVSTSFTYFLVIFLVKYLPGNLYMNQLVSGFSVFGYLIVPALAGKFNNRIIMLMGYIITLIFLGVMLAAELGYLDSTGELGYSIVFLLFKSGVSMVFISLFVIHQDLFHTKYLTSSYGVCNIFSRIAILAAPRVAEIQDRAIPVGLMILLNALALVAAYKLRMHQNKSHE